MYTPDNDVTIIIITNKPQKKPNNTTQSIIYDTYARITEIFNKMASYCKFRELDSIKVCLYNGRKKSHTCEMASCPILK